MQLYWWMRFELAGHGKECDPHLIVRFGGEGETENSDPPIIISDGNYIRKEWRMELFFNFLLQ